MTQLGERLQRAREEQGLTLAEAATATRILPRYLQALEVGDYQGLPGDVYARGFIRNYAQLLHLPSEELIQLYRQERGEATGKIRVVPAAQPPRTRSCLLPSISFLGTFFVILFLVALVYFGAQGLGLFTKRSIAANVTPTLRPVTPTSFPITPETATAVANSGATGTTRPAGATAQGTGTAVSSGSATAVGPTPSAAPSALPGQVVVSLVVLPQSGGSWVEVRGTGVPPVARLFGPGQSGTWTGQRDLYMNIGDTSAVVLTVNGLQCAGFPWSVHGVPRRITFTAGNCP
ncbi:MAG: DUF4115 domain-containing protein [Herpetosiphonaceae bacterium]|nr:DUF4115 domain-containing protein [Herpetosiphonaceae bacterium]